MKNLDTIFDSYSSINGIYSAKSSNIDIDKYRGFLFTFKYNNKYLDSAFIPKPFLNMLDTSAHCYVLNSNGESRAEIYYNQNEKKFVITFNTPYYPVSIRGIY